MDVAEVAERLYALLPEDFTAARDCEVKQARADGDRPRAAAIAALRRPSLAAWLVNALVRHRRDEVEQLLTLGEALRTAQQGLAGDDLRALARQRQQVLAALGRQARALARELGHAVSDDVGLEVEQTLGAAMADPGIAEAVRSGRLTSPTSYAGLGARLDDEPPPPRRLTVVKEPPSPAAGKAPRAAGRGSAPDADEQARRRDDEARRREEEARRREAERRAAEVDQARHDLAEAEQAFDEAEAAALAAHERHGAAGGAVEALAARIEELQEELRRTEHELSGAHREERVLRREQEGATRLANLAHRARDRARERLQRLDASD